ncbi:Uncharacterised protein [Mycobacteroides abscessus subsp. abscessus]|nr:Uncharacterised protein [Mycobacteroides abscessus subsp. abscessus]
MPGLCRRQGVRSVDADDARGAAGASGLQHLVDGSLRLKVLRLLTDAVRFGTDIVHGTIDFTLAQDGLDLVGQRNVLIQIDRLAPVVLHQIKPVLVVVADDDAGRTQQPRRRRTTAADRTGTGDIHRRARLGARLHQAMKGRGQNVRKQGEIKDLLHRLVFVREPQQLEVGVRDEQVLGLTTLPVAEVEPVRAARDVGIRGLADIGTARLTVATPPAGNVERNRDEITLGEELDVVAHFDDLTGHLVAHDHPLGHRKRASEDVQVAAADVGGDHFQDRAMGSLLAVGHDQFRILQRIDPHVPRIVEDDCAITFSHGCEPPCSTIDVLM